MPVKSPQAGRPDATTEKKAARPEPRKTPTAQKSAPVKKDTVTKKTVKKKAPAKKPAVAEKPEPQPDRYQDTLSAIEKLQQKKQRQDEITALQQKIAALSDTRRDASVRSELGMPEGTGDEAGSSFGAYLQGYLKKNWSLSQYQVSSLDLEAKVELTYDAEGNLLDYRFEEKSGNKLFDDSLKKAILKANPLPFEPGERWTTTVTFNLKELRN